ncbi:hypothetical protein AB0O65_09225 [Microbacterium sp. NPDC077391]|nr:MULTISPECIES: hypothetical protein [unclassified Microbacterium]
MFIVIIIGALALWGAAATIAELRRDGFRATPTDWARVAENDRTVPTR